MKINLLQIEKQERSKGRRFRKQMKQAWDSVYEDIPLSARHLRVNVPRFLKRKALMNFLDVQITKSRYRRSRSDSTYMELK